MKQWTIKGQSLPAIGFGTSGLSGRRCTNTVLTALAAGYRHIDTAQAYGNEAAIGAALADTAVPRNEIFLTTKVWMANLAYRDVLETTADSLDALRTDYVDLLLVHWPNDRIPMAETFDAMAELQASGKTRHIGVCNFTMRHLEEAVTRLGADLFCNQVEYHVMLDQSRILSFLRDHGMALVAYSPLGRGRLTGNTVLAEIGRKHGKSASQVALRWLIDQDNVAVIPKAASEAHLKANLDIEDVALDDEDRAAIATLASGMRVLDPGWAPAWDPE